MQIFELKSVEIVGNKRPDGSYKTDESQLGIFDSRQNAEAFMKIVIENEKSYSRFFAFFIYEKTLNDGLSGPWNGISEFKAAWSYLPDGSFIATAIAMTVAKSIFMDVQKTPSCLRKEISPSIWIETGSSHVW